MSKIYRPCCFFAILEKTILFLLKYGCVRIESMPFRKSVVTCPVPRSSCFTKKLFISEANLWHFNNIWNIWRASWPFSLGKYSSIIFNSIFVLCKGSVKLWAITASINSFIRCNPSFWTLSCWAAEISSKLLQSCFSFFFVQLFESIKAVSAIAHDFCRLELHCLIAWQAPTHQAWVWWSSLCTHRLICLGEFNKKFNSTVRLRYCLKTQVSKYNFSNFAKAKRGLQAIRCTGVHLV